MAALMDTGRERMRVAAGLLVTCEGKVLLVKQRPGGRYSIPKGTVEGGEDLLSAAVRETREETGLDIPREAIDPRPRLCSVSVPGCRRRLYYFRAQLPPECAGELRAADAAEIESCAFHSPAEAASLIQVSQAGLLWDGRGSIPLPVIHRLEAAGWIRTVPHPFLPLTIVSYTRQCKLEQAWNEVTLWARGLAVGEDGRIAARSMKKFFEWGQLYPECRPSGKASVTEKIDGHMVFSYMDGTLPRLASRGSFCDRTATEATGILHRLYPEAASRMDPSLTYVLEAVYPAGRLVLDYGDTEELTLLDIVDPSTGQSVLGRVPNPGFPRPEAHADATDIQDYLHLDIPGHEGVVLRFPDGERIKVKYPWFKKAYMRQYHTNKQTNHRAEQP